MKAPEDTRKLTRLSDYLVAIILLLIPLHAFLTIFLASHLGHYGALRVWKELLLPPLGIICIILLTKSGRLKTVLKDRLVILIAVYGLICLASGAWALWHAHTVNRSALIYGLMINLRFLIFFLLCSVAATHSGWLKLRWKQLVMIPAALVVGFGLLQQFVLPADVLRHAGYKAGTIEPYQTIDLKPDYVRLQSTLRGPNPLGVYLVLIMSLLFVLAIKDFRRRALYVMGAVATGIVMFFTYSRSSMLAALLSLGLVIFLSLGLRWKRIALAAALTMLIVGGGAGFKLKDNDHFQNIFFHTDEHSTSMYSSNSSRASAITSGLRDIRNEPLGRGTGTAGPASAHNDHPEVTARIAENYLLQIGQETGIFGLGLFLAINVIIGWRLWLNRKDQLSLILFVAFIAISLINLLSHAWADDTISYMFWGLTGIALASRSRLKS
jgi:hypothetical protein